MSDLDWLNEYSGQSTEELIALGATHRLDSLVLAFEQAIDQKRSDRGDACITIEERFVLAIEAFEREVMNGGFEQFFLNSSVEYAPIIVTALKQIGCPQTALIAERAIRALGTSDLSPDAIGSSIEGLGDSVAKVLNKCDDELMEYPEDIASRLFEYIKVHRERIQI